MSSVEYQCMKCKKYSKEDWLRELEKHRTITQLAKTLDVDRNTIYYHFKQLDIQLQKTKFNHSYFHSIDTQDKAYWLGFAFADGNVFCSKKGNHKFTIKLAYKDIGHLEKFKNSLDCNLKIHKTDGVYVCLYSNEMCADLISHGCTTNKSLTLKYPKIDPLLDQHFIRGYFDGDGSVCSHNKGSGPRINFIGTEIFLTTLQDKFHNYHGTTYKKLRFAGKARVFDNTAYKQVRKIMDWMYDDADIFLDRKREKYLSLRKFN